MPNETVTLPTPDKKAPAITATLVYLETSEDSGRLMYLHRIKHCGTSFELSASAELYWLGLHTAMNDLAHEVETLDIKFDLLVAPPSSAAHLYAPYRAELKRRFGGAEDISGDFSRREGAAKSARSSSLQEIIDSWTFALPDSVPDGERVNVLFVDDVYAGGKSAAAAHHHLQKWLAGRPIALTIACPLRTIPSRVERVDYLALAGQGEG